MEGYASWLHAYLKHTERMEAPTLFHRWVAIGVVGHVLGRRVWLPKEGNYAVFPGQIMVCLVSPSAVVRKSTALSVGVKLLEAVERRLPGTGIVNRVADRGSGQSFMQQMRPRDEMGMPLTEADCVALIVASELGSFMSNDSWTETIPTLITALNDAPTGEFDEKTLSFGPATWRDDYTTKTPVELTNPCVGMLAATTPTGLAKEIPSKARQAGLFGRVVWVYAEDTDKQPNPMTSPTSQVPGLHKELAEELVRISQYTGPAKWNKDAKTAYDAWYDIYLKTPTPRDTSLASGFHARKHDHILRVALVLAAMEASVGNRSGRLCLQLPHIAEATRLIDRIERCLPRCFMHLPGKGRVQLEMKILQLTNRHPERWFDRHTVVKRMWNYGYNTSEVDEACRQLVEVKHIRKRGGGIGAEYKFRPSAGAMLRLAREAETDDGSGEQG